MPNISAEIRDSTGPVWDMSQERAFLENSLGQRFNFFLVFYGFVLNSSINAKTQFYLSTVLGIGTLVCWALTLSLKRSQRRLDIAIDELLLDGTHPLAIIYSKTTSRWHLGRRKVIGYIIPTFCSSVLLVGAVLALVGVLKPSR